MQSQKNWGWFPHAPKDLCDNETVADACFRGASVRVLSNDGTIAKIEYKGSVDSVPAEGMLDREAPAYSWGDAVLISSCGKTARVVDVCWHYKQQRYYYLEDPTGRPIKKRYFEDELEAVR